MEDTLCELCPRKCKVNRNKVMGFCKAGNELKLAKAYIHLWEEPCISGEAGSGTIFFSNCNLNCVFCQNHSISSGGFGKTITIERLAQIMLELQEKKANNINLVTPTMYIPFIKGSILLAKAGGLKIPIIYNSSGYEEVDALKELEGLIDIYLPDIKYFSDKYSMKYSFAPNYFYYASKAILEMVRQVGTPIFEKDMLIRGVMIRHLMLPGLLFDSKKIVDWIVRELPKDIYVSFMCQYTPMGDAAKFPEINKKVSEKHYEALLNYAIFKGLERGFFQDFESATDFYIPDFNLEGV